LVSRTWKSRPATCPCRTALAASSAVISVSVSLAWQSYGWPQASSRYETRRRARRAPRWEDVKRIENSRMGWWRASGVRCAGAGSTAGFGSGYGSVCVGACGRAPGEGEVSLFMGSTLTWWFYRDEIRRTHGWSLYVAGLRV
jgi:hypothetical protein